MKKVFRHGDVNLIQVSKEQFNKAKQTGKAVKHNGTYVLAKGEATGSVHEITCPDMELILEGDSLWLRIGSPAKITHTSDHETITAEPDYYVQVPEREVNHFGESVIRKVVD